MNRSPRTERHFYVVTARRISEEYKNISATVGHSRRRQDTQVHAVHNGMHVSRIILYLGDNVGNGKYKNIQLMRVVRYSSDIVATK